MELQMQQPTSTCRPTTTCAERIGTDDNDIRSGKPTQPSARPTASAITISLKALSRDGFSMCIGRRLACRSAVRQTTPMTHTKVLLTDLRSLTWIRIQILSLERRHGSLLEHVFLDRRDTSIIITNRCDKQRDYLKALGFFPLCCSLLLSKGSLLHKSEGNGDP